MWTSDELENLKHLLKTTKTYAQIGNSLGKTAKAVQHKVAQIKKGELEPNINKSWTTKDLKQLKKMYRYRSSRADIADSLGRSVKAIAYQIQIMRANNPGINKISREEIKRREEVRLQNIELRLPSGAKNPDDLFHRLMLGRKFEDVKFKPAIVKHVCSERPNWMSEH